MAAVRTTKIVYAVRTLSTLQVLVFAWLLQIYYVSGHSKVMDENYWLSGFFPAGLFVIFGLVNLLLVIIVAVKSLKQKKWPDRLTIALVSIVIFLAVFAGPILQFVDRH